jgi:hypothetical protein
MNGIFKKKLKSGKSKLLLQYYGMPGIMVHKINLKLKSKIEF